MNKQDQLPVSENVECATSALHCMHMPSKGASVATFADRSKGGFCLGGIGGIGVEWRGSLNRMEGQRKMDRQEEGRVWRP